MVMVMYVVTENKDKTVALPAKELRQRDIKALSADLAQKILFCIATEAKYPKEIAREPKVHEQKVYYHIKNLEKAGVIKVVKQENRQGAIAHFYMLTEPSFIVRFKEFEQTHKLSAMHGKEKTLLEPFILDGKLDAQIIVGSPDPHGPDKARSRDGYYGIDFGLFLGTFLNAVQKLHVKLDTEIREEDLQQNLIIIGGPITNKIMERVNEKLPVYFDRKNDMNIYSSFSKNSYTSDDTGIIVKTRNPFAENASILVLAGKRHSGTRAAIIAFLQGMGEILKGNAANPKALAKVVEGIDLDSDGIVDAVEFRE